MKIGIDLGGSHIAIGLVDEQYKIIKKQEKRIINKEKIDIKKYIEDYIIENVKQFINEYSISEVGLAVPGTVNNNTIIKSVNLGIENYKIIDKLQTEINLPIIMKNDAKCAALAESKIGAIKQFTRSIFLTLGTGIGGAVIINGQLLDTGNMPGCEIGHMIIEKNGLQCNCGKKGCFEKYASMKALKNNLRKALGVDENVRGAQLLEIIKKDDNIIVKKIVEEFIDNLSVGISNLINIFEPEAIGIGGSFIYFSEVLLDKLKKNIIRKNYLFNKRKEIIILPAQLGNDAGIIGSVVCQ